jgi:hypothetical protein
MDKYASTCADWARTGEPKTAYSGLFLTSDPFGLELTLQQSPRPSLPSASDSPTFASLLGPRLKDPIPMRPRPARLKAPAPAQPVLLVTITITRAPATTPALSPSLSTLSLPRLILATMPPRLALASVPSWLLLLLWPLLYKRSNATMELGSEGVN